jgi:hypothetical protein
MGEAMRVYDHRGLAPRLKRQSVLVDGSGEARDRCAVDPLPDGPRYAACGDAVTSFVPEWICRRLLDFERGGLK